MAFMAAQVYIIYFVFIEDRIIVDYFLNHQIISPLFNIKINSNIEFWLFLLLVQFKFE